jgi:nitroreductase
MQRKDNKAIENILSRRSIRRFDPAAKIPREHVELLLECACAAPSAHNYRPWQFIVVEDRERLDKIRAIHPYSAMLKEAPLAIIVCGYTRCGDKTYPFWEEDCSAAMQNMLLAANATGLGSVWLGVRHGKEGLEEKIKALHDVPEDVAVLGIAALGHPLETKDPHKGVDPCVIHVNKW